MSRELPSWWGVSLPCGCVRGVRLCSDGEQLWNAVADAHKPLARWLLSDRTFYRYTEIKAARSDYDAALTAFTAHVEPSPEFAVQEVLL